MPSCWDEFFSDNFLNLLLFSLTLVVSERTTSEFEAQAARSRAGLLHRGLSGVFLPSRSSSGGQETSCFSCCCGAVQVSEDRSYMFLSVNAVFPSGKGPKPPEEQGPQGAQPGPGPGPLLGPFEPPQGARAHPGPFAQAFAAASQPASSSQPR